MAFVIATWRSFVAPYYNYKHHFLCGAAHGRMLHTFMHAGISYYYFKGVSPGAFIRYAHSQVPFHYWFASTRYATFALALSLLGRIALQSVLLFYGVGQVVRSGTSYKAPYTTWLFVTALAIFRNPRAK